MLHFIAGSPGQFTRWCEDTVLALMSAAHSDCELVRVAAASELGLRLLERRGGGALVSLNQGALSLRAALCESPRKFLVAHDDPRRSLFELVAGGTSLAEAVRAVASSAATLPLYASAPNALVLPAPGTAETALAIADHLGLDAGVAVTLPAFRADPAGDTLRWWQSLKPQEIALITAALGPFLDAKAPRQLDWRPGLFWHGDDRSKPLLGPVDITGRARCLFSGPAIMLPPGQWHLVLRLSVSEMATDQTFQLEIAAGPAIISQSLRAIQAGEAEYNFDFAIADMAAEPLMIRFLLTQAAFDGTVDLLGARIAPRS